MNSRIERFDFHVVESKLKHNYNLAHANLSNYSSALVEIDLSDGQRLWGEVTPLVGYTDETMPTILEDLAMIRHSIVGMSVEDSIVKWTSDLKPANSFVLSSVLPPLEAYRSGYDLTDVSIEFKDIIYALALEEKSALQVNEEIRTVLQSGYDTVKIKVGKHIDQELEWIDMLAQIDLKNLKIRFDANCGYSLKESLLFLDRVAQKIPGNVEYLEQPMGKSCWDEMGEIIRTHPKTPIMIDESIYSIEDIQRSYDIGARIIKLKLCKFGSLGNLQNALDYAKALGLEVVFGNGVATDISNCYEILFYKQNIDKIHGAIESVGFLKLDKFHKFNMLR